MSSKQFAEGVAALLLVAPLIQLTRTGYDRVLWWQPAEIDVLPFPAPLTVRTPMWPWYALFWAATLYASGTAVRQTRSGSLAIVAAAVESFYAILRGKAEVQPLAPHLPVPVLSFALWHNALTEEVLFRGVPLFVGTMTGLSRQAWWRAAYVALSAVGFGLYHYRLGRRSRAVDTAIFGAVLAAVASRDGLPAAILLHSVRNALSLPLNQTSETVRRWEQRRRLYIAALSGAALLRLGAR